MELAVIQVDEVFTKLEMVVAKVELELLTVELLSPKIVLVRFMVLFLVTRSYDLVANLAED